MDFNKLNTGNRYLNIYNVIKFFKAKRNDNKDKEKNFFKIRRSFKSLWLPLRMIMILSFVLFMLSDSPMKSILNIASQNDTMVLESKELEKSSLPLFVFYTRHEYFFDFCEIESTLDSLFEQIEEKSMLRPSSDPPPRVTVYWENAYDLIYEEPLKTFALSWNTRDKKFNDSNADAEIFYKNIYSEEVQGWYNIQDAVVLHLLLSENGKELYRQDLGLDYSDFVYRRFEYFQEAIHRFPIIQLVIRHDRQSYESFLLKLEYMTKEVERELKALDETWETASDELIRILQEKIWKQEALKYRFHTLRYDLKDLVSEINKEFKEYPGVRIIAIRGFGHKDILNKILLSEKYKPKIYFSKATEEEYKQTKRNFEEPQSGSSGFLDTLKWGVRDLYDEIRYLWESDYWEDKAFAIFFFVVLPVLLIITIIAALIDSYSFRRKLNKRDVPREDAKFRNKRIRDMCMRFKKKVQEERQIDKSDGSEDPMNNPDKLDKLLKVRSRKEHGKNL
mgnify:CR=1 FL=1